MATIIFLLGAASGSRLAANHTSHRHGQFRLVVENELITSERVAYPLQYFAPRLDSCVSGNIEHVVSILASLLGHIHRLIGVAQQEVGI